MNFPGFVFDARDLFDTVEDGEDDDHRVYIVLQITRDIASVALTTVHYLDVIIEEEDKRVVPPPTKPLALSKMPVRYFQDVVSSVKRRIVTVLGANAPIQACDERRELRKLVMRAGSLKRSLRTLIRRRPLLLSVGHRLGQSFRYFAPSLLCLRLSPQAQVQLSTTFLN